MAHRPLEDWEYPEPDDDEDDDVAETTHCPACGEEIYEDTEHCLYCGEYITRPTSVLHGRSWWFTLLALAGVAAVIWVMIRYF